MTETDAQTIAGATVPTGGAPRQGEPCEHCGAPLASDQRYCLECGQRRGAPRVDYRHYMGAASAPEDSSTAQPAAGEGPATGEGPEKGQRDYAPLAAVGGIAVLGLMLLVGVLIGKSNDSGTSSAPPVIRVPVAESSESGEGGGSQKNTSGAGFGGANSAKKAKNGSGKGGGGTGNAVKASEGDLEELGNTSGEDYVKQSENLPNEIATPGKPPPIDKSEPPGGGEGGAEVIK
jgi:hypothetical protein